MAMLSPGSLLHLDWYKTPEGHEAMATVFERSLQKRKIFGLLEKPMAPPHFYMEEVKYKIFVAGKTGVGKTSTIAKLSGNEVPSVHSETPGIQTTTIYWPGKILQLNRMMMFHLQFWDAGENAVKKFDHVLPACTDKVDGLMFLFSFVDKSSFEDISHQITRLTSSNDNICKLVMGTKFDQHAHSEITQRDIRDFEHQWHIPVLKIRNSPGSHHAEGKNDFNEVVNILNTLCEHLWHRDIMVAGKSHHGKTSSVGNDGKISYC